MKQWKKILPHEMLCGAVEAAWKEWSSSKGCNVGEGRKLTRHQLLRRALRHAFAERHRALSMLATNTRWFEMELKRTLISLEKDRGIKIAFSAGVKDDCEYPKTIRLERSEAISSSLSSSPGAVRVDFDMATQREALANNGCVVLSGVLDAVNLNAVKQHINSALGGSLAGNVQMRECSGNGRHSAYGYLVETGYVLDELRQKLAESMFDANTRARALETRSVVLSYGKGGINYLHKDQGALPLQAVLLLSSPDVDFSGGSFIMTSASSNFELVRTNARAGDVIIFCAQGSWFHGVEEVRCAQGSGNAQRFALGMFHQKDHERSRLRKKRKRKEKIAR